MKLMKALLGVAAMFLVVVASANAQTIAMNGIGSSALFLEMGQAAALSPSIGANCVWTVAKGTATGVDSRYGSAPGTAEAGQFWVAWQPGTGTCAAPAGSYNIYSYLQTDSTVGDRCLMASPACTLNLPVGAVGTAGANLLSPVTDVSLPAVIQSTLNSQGFNVAGTDIRPEDAKFATIRALTDCGEPVNGVAGSQYLGLGYRNNSLSAPQYPSVGVAISGAGSGSTAPYGSSFNVVDFNLVGTDPITGNAVSSFAVYDVGLVPVVVFVNPVDGNGFGSSQVQNVSRGVLAGYLDGTFGRTEDAIGQTNAATGNVSSTVFVREPLSGTYNTMEYAIPNNTEIQSSQDVGLASQNAFNAGLTVPYYNCTGSAPQPTAGQTVLSNALNVATHRGGSSPSNSKRERAIGTGNEVKAVLNTTDSLGYSFWGTSNFASANAANAKYLTVDGVDPLQQVWQDGLVPTTSNGLLGNVTFANVKNGSYPIWSKLRLAATPSGQTGASALATAAQTFVSPTQPDFVLASQVEIVRSHFAPPFNAASPLGYNANFPSAGVNQPSNGDCSASEAGGDVAGLIYTLQADGDFCADTGIVYGNNGRRQ